MSWNPPGIEGETELRGRIGSSLTSGVCCPYYHPYVRDISTDHGGVIGSKNIVKDAMSALLQEGREKGVEKV
jgi:hypothetical protein